ncbi:hypothetical protein B0H11DRAFT_2242603 [Mycena galericulata]|nr:hypothetical protein B0H11DRAFT_2242603 [Mycena galericulata]
MSYVRSFYGEAIVEAFSSWMYITEEPEPKDIGKRETRPGVKEFMARFTADSRAEEDALSLGPESDDGMQVDNAAPMEPKAVTEKDGTVEVKQREAPTPTFQSLDQILLTPYLLFPQMPGTFEIARMVAWLNAVSKAIEGCVWRELHRFERKPRADYIVRMRSKEDALKLRGVIGSEVEIRESRFLTEHDYKDMLSWPGTMKAGENTEQPMPTTTLAPAHAPTPAPWWITGSASAPASTSALRLLPTGPRRQIPYSPSVTAPTAPVVGAFRKETSRGDVDYRRDRRGRRDAHSGLTVPLRPHAETLTADTVAHGNAGASVRLTATIVGALTPVPVPGLVSAPLDTPLVAPDLDLALDLALGVPNRRGARIAEHHGY